MHSLARYSMIFCTEICSFYLLQLFGFKTNAKSNNWVYTIRNVEFAEESGKCLHLHDDVSTGHIQHSIY